MHIDAPFRVQDGQATYVACHNESYVQEHKFNVVKFLKCGSTFFLNTTIAAIEDPDKRLVALEELVSPKILRILAIRRIKFYIMDAASLANRFGLMGRINMICMCVFFRLSNVLPLEDAVRLLKDAICKTYSYKGKDVVKKNHDILDAVVSDENNLILVSVPFRWKTISDGRHSYTNRHFSLIDNDKTKKFIMEIADPVSKLQGDEIPVSKFLENHVLGGVMIPGTTRYEKRNPNPSGKIPVWDVEKCTQCNQCVFVCPHAAIRPFLVTKDEAAAAPYSEKFKTAKALGSELVGLRYALRISPLDCTGCNACVEACPEDPKALVLDDIEDYLPANEKNWDYAVSLPDRGSLVDAKNVKGSQFQTPLMEFSGACSGCGETPYFKLLTQLFGERMLIANATGCSSIWGGSFPSNPYTVSKNTGRGPAWANSLFEDNAEYGFGMFSSMKHRRERLVRDVKEYMTHFELRMQSHEEKVMEEERDLSSLLMNWLDIRNEKSLKCSQLFDKMKPLFKDVLYASDKDDHSPGASLLSRIWSGRDMFPKLSQWIVGGDGWAYDIGFGGLDHIEAFEANDLNVLVVDTEMYSNTGGQQSKSTPAGASVKFAMGGKQQTKKNMGEIFMTYEHVYVASVCLSNMAQTLQAIIEADQYNGPSIVIAYSPCIEQHIQPRGQNDMFDECRFAVDSGYWPLYRYNPKLICEGKNPFILDSKKLRKEVTAFLKREGRFNNLKKSHPEVAEELFAKMNRDVQHRMEHLREKSAGYKAFDHKDNASVRVLFASETGTAACVARDFAAACILSHDADAMDDVEVDELDGTTTIFFVATCGQGLLPQNGKELYKELCSRTEPFTEGTKFMVMGLGDSSYYFFCKAAKDVEARMLALGAKQILPIGTGDDSADEGKEIGLHEFLDQVWPALDISPPTEVPHIVPIKVNFSYRAILRCEDDESALRKFYASDDVKAVPLVVLSNELQCREVYMRDFRDIQIDTDNLCYNLGDAIDIFPHNSHDLVMEFLHNYSFDFGDHTVINLHAWGVDGEISLGCLFINVLDLFGKPNMHFMQQLATFETDEHERRTILDPNFLKKAEKRNGMTIADVLMHFNKAQPPLPALLAMIPLIKPRAYSIASSPNATPNIIDLCVLIETWWCDEGMKYGLTSDMLRNLRRGDKVWCRIKPGSMEPPTPEQPVVCAGIGSGLAPHLAFLRDRVCVAEAGENIAPFSLYFGNRFKEEEFIYRNELEFLADKHSSWFSLHTAFSRDNPNKKVYVQDLIARSDDARQLLLERSDGMLYVCGNRNLPKPLQKSLIVSFSQNSENPDDIKLATKAVEDMFVHGRAQQEVW